MRSCPSTTIASPARSRSGTCRAQPERKGEGRPKLEAAYVDGKLSGMKRSWYPDGRVRAEFRYDAGALVEARAFSPAGAPLPGPEAAALAARDAASDEAYLASLEAFVRNHPPRCDNGVRARREGAAARRLTPRNGRVEASTHRRGAPSAAL